MTEAPLTALAVDDEMPNLDELAYLLGGDDRIGRVLTASDATEALRLLREERIDVVFLDIAMPGLSGMDLAGVVSRFQDPPAVVFVTAHAEHAVDAFAVEAFDYLLKPVAPDRLARVVERLRERTQESAVPFEKIAVVGASGGSELLDYDQVHYVQADGDYSRVFTYDRSYLSTSSLGELETKLGSRFARIHRSHLVNLSKVAGVRRPAPDRFSLQLADAGKTELDVARRQSRLLRERLGL
jgi:DNA-binding LytR/AlgR family response regulator